MGEECEVNIKLIAHPLFALSCMCRDKEMGVSVLEEAIEKIQAAIKERGGEFEIKSKPEIQKKDDGKKEEETTSESGEGGEESDQEDMGDLDDDMKKQLDAIKVDESDGDEEEAEEEKPKEDNK